MCQGRGWEKFVGCPCEAVTPDVWRAIEFADFAKKGHWPLAGGTLDQTAIFLEAARSIWGQTELWRAKRFAAAIDGDDDE